MEITIDEIGQLSIQRYKRLVPQYCPYNFDDARCGDYCPQFGEADGTSIQICNGRVLYFTKLIDERIKSEPTKTEEYIKSSSSEPAGNVHQCGMPDDRGIL